MPYWAQPISASLTKCPDPTLVPPFNRILSWKLDSCLPVRAHLQCHLPRAIPSPCTRPARPVWRWLPWRWAAPPPSRSTARPPGPRGRRAWQSAGPPAENLPSWSSDMVLAAWGRMSQSVVPRQLGNFLWLVIWNLNKTYANCVLAVY